VFYLVNSLLKQRNKAYTTTLANIKTENKMKIELDDKEKVTILGRQFNSIEYIGVIFGYGIFLALIWPLISQSYLLIPPILALLPLIFAGFIHHEIYNSNKLYNKLTYGGIFVTTFIYTYFFLDFSLFILIIHFLANATFGYIFSKKYQ
jgi:hypothetical protein